VVESSRWLTIYLDFYWITPPRWQSEHFMVPGSGKEKLRKSGSRGKTALKEALYSLGVLRGLKLEKIRKRIKRRRVGTTSLITWAFPVYGRETTRKKL